MNYNLTRWESTKNLSTLILNKFGLNYKDDANKLLSVRILAPMCLLKECNVSYPEEIVTLCDIPYSEAINRFERLNMLKIRDKFYTSNMELKVVRQFEPFIKKYNENKKGY